MRKNKLQIWKKYLQISYLTKDLYQKYKKNSQNSTVRKQQPNFKNWWNNFNRYFTKSDIDMANKHMKKCSTSLAISKMQIKTTVRNHYTPNKMAKKNF